MATDDVFRARLDLMINRRHPLAVPATRMPWADIEATLAPLLALKDRSGRLVPNADLFGPTAQLAGTGLSNASRPRLPVRLMVALLYFEHAFNLSLLKSTIEASVSMGVIKNSEFERIIVDTTLQEGAIAHPTDSRLLEIARHQVAGAAKRCGIALKQTFAKEGKELRRKAGGYAEPGHKPS